MHSLFSFKIVYKVTAIPVDGSPASTMFLLAFTSHFLIMLDIVN